MTALTFYRQTISEITGSPDADLGALEGLMRLESGGTLDRFDSAEFRKLALDAKETLEDLDEFDPKIAAWYRARS